MWKQFTIFLALSLTVGCGDGDADNGNGDSSSGASDGAKKYRIAVIPKGTSHDFWKSVHFGAQKAADELGNVEIVWQGTESEQDKEGQIKIVDTFIGNKIDGIVLAPQDQDAFVRVVQRAKRRKIPTVLFDSGLSDLSDVVSYVATNNKKGGMMAGEHLAKVMEGKGGVIMLRYQAGSESTGQREAGFLEAIAKHSGIEVLSENQRIDSKADRALKVSESLLRQHADVDGVFTVCEPNNIGMLLALENERMDGKVRFVAFDSDPHIVKGLKENKIDGVILQDPVNMGYLAVKAMVDHLEGRPVEKRIETGETLVTPENMDEPENARLLEPEQL
jgi:ribose transport system substrate-binding protein